MWDQKSGVGTELMVDYFGLGIPMRKAPISLSTSSTTTELPAFVSRAESSWPHPMAYLIVISLSILDSNTGE